MRNSWSAKVRFSAVALTAALVLLAAAAPASAKVQHGLSPQTLLNGGDYQRMAPLKKLKIMRFGLSWPGIQENPGTCTAQGGACDWAFSDGQIGLAAANGMKTMLGVFGSPPWVNAEGNKPPTNNIPAWREFVRAAAQRYGPGGAYWQGPYQAQFGGGAPINPTIVWQIWNEPSSFQFFKPKPNIKKYAKILRPAADEIHSVHKKATVLTGGMFPDTGPKGIKINKFLKGLYKQKKIKKKTIDGVSVHPYAKNNKQLKKQIGGARRTMNKKGKKSGGKKDEIWITEIGYASGGPKKQPVVKKGEKGQAKAIKSAYKFLDKKDKRYKIKGIIYFTWQDAARSTGVCRFCVHAGLIKRSGGKKKAFNAYKKAIK